MTTLNNKLRLTDCESIEDLIPLVVMRYFTFSKTILYCFCAGSVVFDLYPDTLFFNFLTIGLFSVTFIPDIFNGFVSFTGELIKENDCIFLALPLFGKIKVRNPSLLYIESEKTYYLIRKGFFNPIILHPFLFKDELALKVFIKRLRDFTTFEREAVSPMLVSFYQNNYTVIKSEKNEKPEHEE